MMACVTAVIKRGGVLCYLLLLNASYRSISAWCWNLLLLTSSEVVPLLLL